MSLQVTRVTEGGIDVVTIGGVCHQEPIFALRGRDLLTLPTLDRYLKLCIDLRLVKADGVRRAIREVESWQLSSPNNIVGNDHRHIYARDQYDK